MYMLFDKKNQWCPKDKADTVMSHHRTDKTCDIKKNIAINYKQVSLKITTT